MKTFKSRKNQMPVTDNPKVDLSIAPATLPALAICIHIWLALFP